HGRLPRLGCRQLHHRPEPARRWRADEVGYVRHLVIAIDGPAASGKGTLARRLADHYGLRHLDTGLTYRAVARALMMEDLPLDEPAIAEAAAHNIDLAMLDRSALSTNGIGEAASRVAVMPGVRQILVEKQRAFA